MPRNTQNDRLYVPFGVHKKNVVARRLFCTRPTFSKSVMVSVGVSALGKTSLHFVDPWTKINGKYYRDVLLMRGLLPDICSYSEYFTFQQDGAPTHWARETVDLLKQETPDFIQPTLWPPNSPDLNPVDYAVCGILQDRVCLQERDQGRGWASASRKSGMVLISVWSTVQSGNGASDCKPALQLMVNISNINCEHAHTITANNCFASCVNKAYPFDY